jgi:hypothetical protein
MNNFGPQYCETPDLITGIFPVEPANAFSSGVIVLFGIAALIHVIRRAPNSIELYALCALLIVNGVGSVLWHGLRTRWALTLDVTPALIFVVVVAILWARRVAPLWQIAAVGAGLVAFAFALRSIDLGMRLPGRWGAMAPVIVAAALWLIARSYAVSKTAALTGGLALVSALTALTLRSIDSRACEYVPMGTHFLWHIFLSAAAFLCVVTLVTLQPKRESVAPTPIPAPQ